MSIRHYLTRTSESDRELLDRWIHTNGRKVFTRYLSELSVNLAADVANHSPNEGLEMYALKSAEASGKRKGVLDVFRLLEETLPNYYKKQKDKE